jgi:hypothetical protein
MNRRNDRRKKEWKLMVHYTKMFMYLAVALIVMSIIIAVII